MTCEECGLDKPLTYRSLTLQKKSVCADCIRRHHPDTIPAEVIPICLPWTTNLPHDAA